MRTKSLLLSAAVLAAGVATSMASNVYSVNVVGYVTITLTNGFNLISNPLDAVGGGSGVGNTITTAFTALPDNTTVYKFAGGTFGSQDVFFNGIGWVSGGTITFNPGEGLFVQVPSGIPGNSTNVTFVGTVMQGTNNPTPIPNGYSIVAAQPPVNALFTTDLNYQPNDGDTVYQWSSASQGYPNQYVYIAAIPAWVPSEPANVVGQAIFLQNTGAAHVWTNNFIVQ